MRPMPTSVTASTAPPPNDGSSASRPTPATWPASSPEPKPATRPGPDDFQVGDSVEASGRWHQVIRVNPTSLIVPSVAGGNGTHTTPYDAVTDRRPATHTAGQRVSDVTEHQQSGQEPNEN
ncbi:MAG: hypothetical protein ACREQ5_36260 [Candidatus Dormibacteria bacterium]